jgi:hypothetical protein
LAHARRYFDGAAKTQGKAYGRARQALDMIGRLYQVEALAKGELPAVCLNRHGRRHPAKNWTTLQSYLWDATLVLFFAPHRHLSPHQNVINAKNLWLRCFT